jgi:hypothetical protein
VNDGSGAVRVVEVLVGVVAEVVVAGLELVVLGAFVAVLELVVAGALATVTVLVWEPQPARRAVASSARGRNRLILIMVFAAPRLPPGIG